MGDRYVTLPRLDFGVLGPLLHRHHVAKIVTHSACENGRGAATSHSIAGSKMTIRPRFPRIYRLIGACRLQASRICQKFPAGAAGKRPERFQVSDRHNTSDKEAGPDAISSLSFPYWQGK